MHDLDGVGPYPSESGYVVEPTAPADPAGIGALASGAIEEAIDGLKTLERDAGRLPAFHDAITGS